MQEVLTLTADKVSSSTAETEAAIQNAAQGNIVYNTTGVVLGILHPFRRLLRSASS